MTRWSWLVVALTALGLGCGSVVVDPDGDTVDGTREDADGNGADADADADGDADVPDVPADVEADVPADGVIDVGPRCGNGALDDDAEECDDGNGVDGDGCDTDCTFSCATSDDCMADSNPCTDQVCRDGGTGRLCASVPVAGEVLCDDGDPCSGDDRCVGGVCVGTLVVPRRYRDADGDGYGDSASWICSDDATDPHWVGNDGDCCDDDIGVHPDVSIFHTDWYGCGSLSLRSWDWNCDSLQQPEYVDCQSCVRSDSAGDCAAHSGWAGSASCIVPACGEAATYVVCEWDGNTNSCTPGTPADSRTQGCR